MRENGPVTDSNVYTVPVAPIKEIIVTVRQLEPSPVFFSPDRVALEAVSWLLLQPCVIESDACPCSELSAEMDTLHRVFPGVLTHPLARR